MIHCEPIFVFNTALHSNYIAPAIVPSWGEWLLSLLGVSVLLVGVNTRLSVPPKPTDPDERDDCNARALVRPASKATGF